jgi:glutathione synthase/RimK-type ligase-like ATP-grasp enzyme
MILLCGDPKESPLRMVSERLDAMGCPSIVVDQTDLQEGDIAFGFSGGEVGGRLMLGSRSLDLSDVSAVYTRLDGFGDRQSGDVRSQATEVGAGTEAGSAFIAWLEVCGKRVINRYSAMASNMSKPYQLQLIDRLGFRIPTTLVTNDPEVALSFVRQHRRVVFKSISSTRSIVREVQHEDLARLEFITWCPTQFQELIEGANVRVHVIGETVIASSIRSSYVDYRYSYMHGEDPEICPVDLPVSIVNRCLDVVKALRLTLAGIDLIITPNGIPFCLEVNPSPAFSYYELRSGQPISGAIARFLSGAST